MGPTVRSGQIWGQEIDVLHIVVFFRHFGFFLAPSWTPVGPSFSGGPWEGGPFSSAGALHKWAICAIVLLFKTNEQPPMPACLELKNKCREIFASPLLCFFIVMNYFYCYHFYIYIFLQCQPSPRKVVFIFLMVRLRNCECRQKLKRVFREWKLSLHKVEMLYSML